MSHNGLECDKLSRLCVGFSSIFVFGGGRGYIIMNNAYHQTGCVHVLRQFQAKSGLIPVFHWQSRIFHIEMIVYHLWVYTAIHK